MSEYETLLIRLFAVVIAVVVIFIRPNKGPRCGLIANANGNIHTSSIKHMASVNYCLLIGRCFYCYNWAVDIIRRPEGGITVGKVAIACVKVGHIRVLRRILCQNKCIICRNYDVMWPDIKMDRPAAIWIWIAF